MAEDDVAAHLGSHHRNTVHRIFEHPTSHNIECHGVVSLLDAIGSVERHHDNKVELHVGSSTEFFGPRTQGHRHQRCGRRASLLPAAGYEG